MRLATAVVLTWLLAGCTATSLARIQVTYNDLMLQRQAMLKKELPGLGNASSGAAAADEAVSLSMQDLERAFLTLAQEAQESASRASDPRTRVALLRTAGLAAWQAGEQGLDEAMRIQTKGRDECRGLADQRFGAPRDCALLRALVELAVASDIEREVQQLEKARAAKTLKKEDVDKLATKASAAATRLAGAKPGDGNVDESVKEYFERQVFLASCNQLGVLRLARALNDNEARALALKEYCSVRKLVAPSLLVASCPGESKPAAETCS